MSSRLFSPRASLDAAAQAQVSASLSGRVTDPNGAPLPGVTVTARGEALQRESLSATTGADGAYRLSPLPPGTYSLSFARDGFAIHTVDELRAGVNETVTVDAQLAIEAVAEELHVVGARPLVEIERSEVATRIEEVAIDTLPLKTRDPEDLVALVPGVTQRPDAVRDQRFSIFGERPAATSYVYDGADNNDPLDGGSFQRYAQDAIQEFEVITTGYQAEFGRAQGGIVNVVTRSGTDDFEGRAFYFYRDDSLDSSNVSGQDAPELSRDQYGLSLGGPIQRDRSFFFAAGEIVDEQRGRNIDLSTVPDWVQSGLATAEGSEDLSAGPTFDGATFLGKVDLLPTAAQRWTLSGNYTDDDADGEIPTGIAGALVLPSAARLQQQESLGGTLLQTTVLSPKSILESSARYLEGETGTNLDKTERAEAVLLLFLSGFIQTGAQLPGGRAERDIDRLALDQSWSRLAGDHSFEAGWEFLDTSLTGFEEVSNDVEYSGYFLFPDAIARNEDLFERFGFQHEAARFFFLSADPDGSLNLDIGNDDLGLYAQDQWRVLSNVTLDLGLRYDRASLFGDDDDNVAPRAGVTWDVGGRHRTVVKASGGLFYDQNALLAATGVPEKGGFFRQTGFDVAMPRLGAVYTDSLIDLVITSGFPIGRRRALAGGEPALPRLRRRPAPRSAAPLPAARHPGRGRVEPAAGDGRQHPDVVGSLPGRRGGAAGVELSRHRLDLLRRAGRLGGGRSRALVPAAWPALGDADRAAVRRGPGAVHLGVHARRRAPDRRALSRRRDPGQARHQRRPHPAHHQSVRRAARQPQLRTYD